MKINIPATGKKRVVIAGAGFAGLKLARSLVHSDFQVVIIDKNNYHQFQPLFYQVATCALEPSTIAFPLRKIFQHSQNIHIRLTELLAVHPDRSAIMTAAGELHYDYLVLAMGTDTNFFGNLNVIAHAMPMKSVTESLNLRNKILQNYEDAVDITDKEEKKGYMSIVVVGGGPTGVEISGALAEMKHYIFPKDYPELDFSLMQLFLVEASPRLLNGMSQQASEKAKIYLEKLGVNVSTDISVKDYDGRQAVLSDGKIIRTRTMIWAAGVTGKKIPGIPESILEKGNRIRVDRYNKAVGLDSVYVIGDIAFMTEETYPKGHPQVAQVAIQQAKCLAENLQHMAAGKPLRPFTYKDRGVMATIGRNRAVADLPKVRFQGFFAWILWMFVHLVALVGFKNKLLTIINWMWTYITRDQSLRLIIRFRRKKRKQPEPALWHGFESEKDKKTTPMKFKKEEMTTLTGCMNSLMKRGFTENFLARENGIEAPSNKKLYAPDKVKILNFYRFEGDSDPADNSILYAVETHDGLRGLLVDSYGPMASKLVSSFIKQVEEIEKKVPGDLSEEE